MASPFVLDRLIFLYEPFTHTRSPSLRHTDDACDASSPILHSSCYLLSLKIFWTAFDIRRAFHPYVVCIKTCHMCISAVVRKCFVKMTYTQKKRERDINWQKILDVRTTANINVYINCNRTDITRPVLAFILRPSAKLNNKNIWKLLVWSVKWFISSLCTFWTLITLIVFRIIFFYASNLSLHLFNFDSNVGVFKSVDLAIFSWKYAQCQIFDLSLLSFYIQHPSIEWMYISVHKTDNLVRLLGTSRWRMDGEAWIARVKKGWNMCRFNKSFEILKFFMILK